MEIKTEKEKETSKPDVIIRMTQSEAEELSEEFENIHKRDKEFLYYNTKFTHNFAKFMESYWWKK